MSSGYCYWCHITNSVVYVFLPVNKASQAPNKHERSRLLLHLVSVSSSLPKHVCKSADNTAKAVGTLHKWGEYVAPVTQNQQPREICSRHHPINK